MKINLLLISIFLWSVIVQTNAQYIDNNGFEEWEERVIFSLPDQENSNDLFNDIEYEVRISAGPEKGGDISGAGLAKQNGIYTGSYKAGTKVEFSADAYEGYAFDRWIYIENGVENTVKNIDGKPAGNVLEGILPPGNIELIATFKIAIFDMAFTVSKQDDEYVKGALISITRDGTELSSITTNDNGFAETRLEAGDYDYTVTADGFHKYTGTFAIAKDDSELDLTLLHHTVDRINPPSDIKVYPNPSSGFFTIEYSGNGLTTITVEVISVTGNMIFLREYAGSATFRETIDLQTASKGVYFLRLNENGYTRTMKMIFR